MDSVLKQYCISSFKKLYDNHMFISYGIIRYNVNQYNNINYYLIKEIFLFYYKLNIFVYFVCVFRFESDLLNCRLIDCDH